MLKCSDGLHRDTRRELRDYLRSKGVYVDASREVMSKAALFGAAQEELEWPEGEIHGTIENGSNQLSNLDHDEDNHSSISLRMYMDSKCLFQSLTSLNTTTEKRLLIDLHMLRECYESREISEVMWIPGAENPADAITKRNASPALERLITENKLEVNPQAWIERDLEPPTWASKLDKDKPKCS